MTSTEPTEAEAEELSGRVRGIIGAYRMGAGVDARDLYLKTAPAATPEPVVVPGEGYIRDGMYHVADPACPRRDEEARSRLRSPGRRTVTV